jgi:hypothetical protein
MIHAALLLLMLEAVHTDLVFTISLKRSTPNSSAIHKLAGRLPHLRPESNRQPSNRDPALWANNRHPTAISRGVGVSANSP